jgi:hypothetical protein
MGSRTFSEWNSIGNRLLRAGKITKKQLVESLRRKGNGSAHLELGEILIEMGACTQADVDEELADQRELTAPPDVDHEASEAAHKKLTTSLDGLKRTTRRASTISMAAWNDDSGKILVG